MVWLSDTKKCDDVKVPGFKEFYNKSKHGNHRSGIMLLIRSKLMEYVKYMDMKTEGQIWVTLAFLVTYKLGGVYIPPEDSPYFHQADIGKLASHTVESGNLVVLGDFNARVAVPNLSNSNNIPYVYTGVVDHTLNARGRSLLNICSNNSMVIANHLLYNNKELGGQLSFRQRDNWISELDLCLASQECIDHITDVTTRQDIAGSDNASLCVNISIPSAMITNINMLQERVGMLGNTHHQSKPGHKQK